MSVDDFQDLKDWLEIIVRVAGRGVIHDFEKQDETEDGETWLWDMGSVYHCY